MMVGARIPRSFAKLWSLVICLVLSEISIGCSHLDAQDTSTPTQLSYNRDVRPILAENCFACHGPDSNKRKANLALHDPIKATEKLANGEYAIVPGHPTESQLVRRIINGDQDEVMPPPISGKHLTGAQIHTLIQWVAEGAIYQPHWAYVPPKAPSIPQVSDPWIRNPIDAFILERLHREHLQESPPSDPITLIRRLSFDLTGLPPTPAEVDDFITDSSEAVYQRTIDRLLASPHYGERMAVSWLDLVRYADTIGYHSDNPRNVTPYRDWVINAFNANMPFDEFTREQLAGDLLPAANLQQRVASGYNRLNLTTEEGGAQAKEYESKSAADRVRNLSAVWLGSTMQCCECHDHKFDPFSQRDFYNMEAFFADIQESAIGPRESGVPVPTPVQQLELDGLDRDIKTAELIVETSTPELEAAQVKWERSLLDYQAPVFGTWYHIGPFFFPDPHSAFIKTNDLENHVDLTAIRSDHMTWTAEPNWKDGEIHHFLGDNSATFLFRSIECTRNETMHLSLGSDDTITLWFDGKQLLSHEIYRGVAPDQEHVDVELTPGHHQLLIKICNGGGDYAYYFKASCTIPSEIVPILAISAPSRTQQQKEIIEKYYRSIAPELEIAHASVQKLHLRRNEIMNGIQSCLVSSSGPVRVVTVKARGNWMDDKGAVCQPTVPHFLAQLESQGRPGRLDLANWLVGPSNPLVARVLVNRLWKQCFGIGLVKTIGDFGTQGDVPANQELLDFLAADIISHGWDIKRTLRLLVSSNTYRQSSHIGSLLDRDPENRLVARQSSFRIDAEFVRDNALAISGLLIENIGGPSVRPYEPAGYLMHLNFPTREWIDDHGDNAYRRGLYTFWQRSFLHPSLLAFDAPSREECTGDRSRSNTPQQALVLLNDPTFVEAARTFAEHIIQQGGISDSQHLAWAFKRALSRPPRTEELVVMQEFLMTQRAIYQQHPKAADELLSVGLHQPSAALDHVDLAVWTAAARLVLNLHETITRN